jgi:hypothetical protein
VSAVGAKYARRRAPLAVQIRDQLGELFPNVEFEARCSERVPSRQLECCSWSAPCGRESGAWSCHGSGSKVQ